MDSVIVLGLGNILYGDEGFGVRVAEQLFRRYDMPDHVEIVDAGTVGHPLLSFVERAKRLLLLDAVDFGCAPGELVVRDSSGIPAYLSAHKVSLHQNSFSEVLALATLTDCAPEEICLVGVQPVDLTFGHSLSEPIRAQLEPALERALAQLTAWGIEPVPAVTAKQFHHEGISLERFRTAVMP